MMLCIQSYDFLSIGISRYRLHEAIWKFFNLKLCFNFTESPACTCTCLLQPNNAPVSLDLFSKHLENSVVHAAKYWPLSNIQN